MRLSFPEFLPHCILFSGKVDDYELVFSSFNFLYNRNPTSIGSQKESALYKSVTIMEGPIGVPNFTRKKVMLLSYNINAPGDTGSKEIIFVSRKAVHTVPIET